MQAAPRQATRDPHPPPSPTSHLLVMPPPPPTLHSPPPPFLRTVDPLHTWTHQIFVIWRR